EYGDRAREAESRAGVDWKALSHAVRIGREAIEFLTTGALTFPLREADHLLRIKRGELPYESIAEEIERLVAEVEVAASASPLPEAPDEDFIDAFVAAAYRGVVAR